MNKILKVGPIKVKINGNDAITNQIIDELGQFVSESSLTIDIELEIHDSEKLESYSPKYFSGGRSMHFNDSQYFVGTQNYFDYVVSNAFDDNPIKIDILIKQKSLNFKQKIKALKRVELSDLTSLIRSAILSYSLFWNVLQLALLKKGCSFIHSAVISRNNRSVILAGSGGAGKTSICLELLKNSEIQYMSEDFGIVDSDGYAYFNPKSISLYKTDIAFGNPIAIKAIENLPNKTKKKWDLLTKVSDENQIVKIPPLELFGKERLSENAKIENALFMIRENCSEIHLEEISLDEYCERITNVTIREMKSLVEILSLISADSPKTSSYKNMVEIFEMTKNIYLKSFSNLQPKLLHIPKNFNPEQVAAFLSKNNII